MPITTVAVSTLTLDEIETYFIAVIQGLTPLVQYGTGTRFVHRDRTLPTAEATRRFTIRFSDEDYAERASMTVNAVERDVMMEVQIDYSVKEQDVNKMVNSDKFQLQEALHARKGAANLDGLMSVRHEGEDELDGSDDGTVLKVAHVFRVRYMASRSY